MCLRGAHPIYFGHFVPPSAALVSAHQLRRGTLFCGATEPETQTKNRGDNDEELKKKTGYWDKRVYIVGQQNKRKHLR